MPTFIGLLLMAVVVGLFLVSLHRARELFVLRVQPGAPVIFVRGRIPPPLLQDLRELLTSSQSRGTLRVLSERGVAVVEVRGAFSPATQQRLRNTVALYSLAKLRSGVGPRRS